MLVLVQAEKQRLERLEQKLGTATGTRDRFREAVIRTL